jgi:uncharacterized membrane protein
MKPSRVPVLFAGIALLFGTALVFLTPPFQVADEFWHFFRAYQISLGQLVAQSRGNTQGGVLPASLLKLSSRFADLPFHPHHKTSLEKILDAGRIPLNPEQTTFCYFPNSANYCPLVYAPQAAAIAVGRSMDWPPLELLYLGREAGLIAWTVLGYFTLKFGGALARPILLLLLMPMSIASAASVSADAMTNAVCLLFTALVWRHSGKCEKMSTSGMAAIFALSIGVTLCKFAYLPLILLILLIPPSRLGGRERYLKFVAALIAVNVLVSFAWLRATAGTNLMLRPDRPDVNVARQLSFLEQHPLAFVPAMARGALADGPFIVHSFIGYLGWNDNPAAPVFVWIYCAALIVACWPMESDPPTPAKWRLALVAGSICASSLLVALLNYLAWTPVGSGRLEGLQGRYFIPLAAAMLLLIWGAMRRMPGIIPPLRLGRFGGKLNLAAVALCVGACLYTSFLVYGRYFAAG